MNTIYMDPDAVESEAGSTEQVSQALETVGNILQMVIAALRAAACVSFGATEAQAQVLSTFVPIVNQLTQWTSDTSQGMNAAAAAYREATADGAQLFRS